MEKKVGPETDRANREQGSVDQWGNVLFINGAKIKK